MIRIAYSDLYCHPVPENHRFPMQKYEWLHKQLLLEGIASETNFFKPDKVELENVLRVHDAAYVHRFINLELSPKEQRQTGFVHDAQLVEREMVIAQGTLLGVDFALQGGCALNIAGGTHHAFRNRGEGFCMLNDQAIAAAYYLERFPEKKVLIIDLDVHQGNGTAQIFEDNSSVFTFSMHGKDNYPLKKEKGDLDIELPSELDGKTYLELLSSALAKIQGVFVPNFIFFQAGVDILETDKLGKLNVSMRHLMERDKLVLNFSRELNVPLVICMGGGYSTDTKIILEAHMTLFREVFTLFG